MYSHDSEYIYVAVGFVRMDAHQLFIRFKDGELPSVEDIDFIYMQEDVRTLELVARMYSERGVLIPMDTVFDYDRAKCDKLSGKMLTPVVVRNSTFKGNAIRETTDALERLSTSETVVATPRSGESKQQKGFNQKYVDECNAYFLKKSKPRVKSMVRVLDAFVAMDWVKAVASKIETEDAFSRDDFEILTGSERHVHISGPTCCHFIAALADERVKSFSWKMDDEQAISVKKCRAVLGTLVSKPESDVVPFAILACSIGLPTFQMYTPETFLTHWHKYRFKVLSNANVIKTVLRDLFETENAVSKTEVGDLLDQYSSHTFFVENEAKSVDTYMFRRWYSYPARKTLEELVECANAIMDQCS